MTDAKSAAATPFPEARQTIQVSSEPELMEAASCYRGKSGGYYVERILIESIIDSSGRVLEPQWKADWTEIAPGIETREVDQGTRSPLGERSRETHISGNLRIFRKACPVYVKILKSWEYIDYNDSSFSSQECDIYWLRYETAK